MKYDDAEYYFLDFTTDLPNENGGRHIALFLEWAIRRGFASEALMQSADALRSGTTTGLDLLFDRCDGKLYSDDLSDEGNAFATACYQTQFMPDFVEAMNVRPDATGDEIFSVDLTPNRQARVHCQLDRRYADWRRKTAGLPGKEALSERVLAAIRPMAEAAGFPFFDNGGWGSHSVRRRFERRGAWGSHGFTVVAEDSPTMFYGVRIEFSADIERLRAAIYHEKSIDLGVVSSIQPAASIPFTRFAEGWGGPVQDYDMRSPGFWIFRDEDIEPLAQWLAERLRRFALPLLRNLDSVDGIALAHCMRPLSASQVHDLDDSYGALLATEMSRHPKLGTLLDDTEQALRALKDTMTARQQGCLSLIARIRTRSRAYL